MLHCWIYSFDAVAMQLFSDFRGRGKEGRGKERKERHPKLSKRKAKPSKEHNNLEKRIAKHVYSKVMAGEEKRHTPKDVPEEIPPVLRRSTTLRYQYYTWGTCSVRAYFLTQSSNSG